MFSGRLSQFLHLVLLEVKNQDKLFTLLLKLCCCFLVCNDILVTTYYLIRFLRFINDVITLCAYSSI